MPEQKTFNQFLV